MPSRIPQLAHSGVEGLAAAFLASVALCDRAVMTEGFSAIVQEEATREEARIFDDLAVASGLRFSGLTQNSLWPPVFQC